MLLEKECNEGTEPIHEQVSIYIIPSNLHSKKTEKLAVRLKTSGANDDATPSILYATSRVIEKEYAVEYNAPSCPTIYPLPLSS